MLFGLYMVALLFVGVVVVGLAGLCLMRCVLVWVLVYRWVVGFVDIIAICELVCLLLVCGVIFWWVAL